LSRGCSEEEAKDSVLRMIESGDLVVGAGLRLFNRKEIKYD